MKKILFLTLMIIIPTISFGQKHLRKTDFSLIIAECFDKDTIDIALNDIVLVEKYIVNSGFSTGTTDLGIYQNDEGLWIQKGQDKQELKRLDLRGHLRVQIKVNEKQTNLELKLKKGKVMVLDYCYGETSQGKPIRMATIQQFRRTVTFE